MCVGKRGEYVPLFCLCGLWVRNKDCRDLPDPRKRTRQCPCVPIPFIPDRPAAPQKSDELGCTLAMARSATPLRQVGLHHAAGAQFRRVRARPYRAHRDCTAPRSSVRCGASSSSAPAAVQALRGAPARARRRPAGAARGAELGARRLTSGRAAAQRMPSSCWRWRRATSPLCRAARRWRAGLSTRARCSCSCACGLRRQRACQSRCCWARRSMAARMARTRRSRSRAACRSSWARSGLTSSAAAVGVGARTSATKSAMVKSVSCPARYHRHRAGRHRARHHLFVERPQVFDAAAATAQDQHVALGPAAGQFEHGGDLLGRSRALHRHG